MSEIARRLRLAMSEVLPPKPIFAHFQTFLQIAVSSIP